MAVDERLAERVRSLLSAFAPSEKAMFGGLAFIVHGHMTVAVGNRGLLVRVDPGAAWLNSDPRVKDAMPGRRMRNWRSFDVDADTEDLPALVEHALDQVRALPRKE
ncbi:hypothetical protein [Gordonia hydrophobica]|uniref:RNA methyltransferase n=1 Tax=Gordonia hydrophobica TaxID=40516 RepID=A0ABZ2TZY4_9ACTN|nr:hypothetical protein [Gordonia hydrophobica]MBM7369423.1 hypothetical protein [Gordonia hydrophobica]